MTAYAVARLKNVNMGAEIRTYLTKIDATLAPFEGIFLIHGGPKLELEGTWPDDLIVIAFPNLATARAWYDSPEYREIIPLRTGNSSGDVVLIDGVDRFHRATDILDPASPGR